LIFDREKFSEPKDYKFVVDLISHLSSNPGERSPTVRRQLFGSLPSAFQESCSNGDFDSADKLWPFRNDANFHPADLFIYGLRLWTEGRQDEAQEASRRLFKFYNLMKLKSTGTPKADMPRSEQHLAEIFKDNDLEAMLRLRTKFVEVNACYKRIINKMPKMSPDIQQECEKILDDFVRDNLKGNSKGRAHYYQKALFRLLCCVYEDASLRRCIGNKLSSELLHVVSKLPGTSLAKQQSFCGSVLLANGDSLVFYDMLKTSGSEFTDDHVKIICDIAHASKEPRILMPLIEMPDFIPDKPELLAEIYNTLALIYGQTHRLDQLEKLGVHLLRSDKNYKNIAAFKHVFYRIHHFYRVANRVLPPLLASKLRVFKEL